MPLLAIALLILNGRRVWMKEYVNRSLTVVVLLATLAFFGLMSWMKWAW